MKQLLTIGLTIAVASTLMSCGDDDSGSVATGVDCGQGDAIELESMVCVYEREVVIENGFNCPAELPNLEELGPIGVCSREPLGMEQRRELARRDREQRPARWVDRCAFDDECAEASCSDDGVCEGTCPDGLELVDSEADCLADGVCLASGDGFCTGPGEVSCPEGLELVDSSGACLQDDAVCFMIAEGAWCTGPSSPECPEGYVGVPSEAQCLDGECFMYSESLWCTNDTAGCAALDEEACNANPSCAPILGAPAEEYCVDNLENWRTIFSGCYTAAQGCGEAETCAASPDGTELWFSDTCTPPGWASCSCP